MRGQMEWARELADKYEEADFEKKDTVELLGADVRRIQVDAILEATRLLARIASEHADDPAYVVAIRQAAHWVQAIVCEHEANPLAPVLDTFPATYWCQKCNQHFQKTEDVEAFQRQVAKQSTEATQQVQAEQKEYTLDMKEPRAMPFTDEEFDRFRMNKGWNMATRDEVARLTATALLYKQEMIAAKKQLEEFREYANKLTQRPPGRGHTGRYGAQGQVGAVVDELGIGPPPAGWPTR